MSVLLSEPPQDGSGSVVRLLIFINFVNDTNNKTICLYEKCKGNIINIFLFYILYFYSYFYNFEMIQRERNILNGFNKISKNI